MSWPAGPPETTERFGRPYRHYQAAVSATAMALAWAHQEAAPDGSTVVVDHEVNALGRLGEPWAAPSIGTLAVAVVLRPALSAEDADVSWLIGSLALLGGIGASSDRPAQAWWPDLVVDSADGRRVGMVKADVDLAGGRVSSAVLTLRMELTGLDPDGTRRDAVLGAIHQAAAEACAGIAEAPGEAVAAYEARSCLIGRRIKLRLRPKGETRGVVAGFDRRGWMQIKSPTGMVESITVDMLRDLVVV